MALKYECPKCGRKFTEWGAERLGFKCPSDQWCKHEGDEPELIVAGSQDESPSRKTSLKRSFRPRPKAVKSLAEEVEPADDADEFGDEDNDAVGTDDDDVDADDGDDDGAAGDDLEDSDESDSDGDSDSDADDDDAEEEEPPA